MPYFPVTIETDWVTIGLTFLSTFLGICASGIFSVWLFHYQHKKEKILSVFNNIYAKTALARSRLKRDNVIFLHKAQETIAEIHDESVLNIMYLGEKLSNEIKNMAIDMLEMDDLKNIDDALEEMQTYILNELKINLKN